MSGETSAQPGAIRSGDDVREMFGRITPGYDRMNRLMTGGRDIAWRRAAVQATLEGYAIGTARVLDLATGTGDLALALAAGGAGRVVGLDFAEPMVRVAQAKATRLGPRGPEWVVGDAMAMPFPDATFDACTVGFGLRNMPDYAAALTEMARVVRPGGRLVCLEMTPLRVPLVGTVVDWGFRAVLPLVGGAVSGDADAYRYLPASVAAFPDVRALAALMRTAGFEPVRWRRFGAGTVALHVGTRARD